MKTVTDKQCETCVRVWPEYDIEEGNSVFYCTKDLIGDGNCICYEREPGSDDDVE